MQARIIAVLPTRWFADTSPLLEGLLSGVSWAWSWAHSLLTYVQTQTRIATATDVWLDIIALDFFGNSLQRDNGQNDAAFRMLIQNRLLQERGTRQAITSVVENLTGIPPVIFEPMRATDTGGYATGGVGYGAGGGWGSMSLPFQCFVTAHRPSGSGIAQVTGWGNPGSGYGTGAIEYASLAMVQGQVTDSDIDMAIAAVLPVAAIAWTRIQN